MAPATAPSRRERLRGQTLDEIREQAWDQIAAGGIESLSLNKIAHAMGMSGPALYRYYGSRDDLIAALVGEAWGSLSDALEQSAKAATAKKPEAGFRALCDSYREWAIEQPYRYGLALETHYGSGRFAPETTLPEAGRAMVVVLDAVMDLGPMPSRRRGSVKALDEQLASWQRSRGLRADAPAAALKLALLCQSRLHGIVSLELTGTFASMELDPALLFRSEVDLLLAHHRAVGAAAGASRG